MRGKAAKKTSDDAVLLESAAWIMLYCWFVNDTNLVARRGKGEITLVSLSASRYHGEARQPSGRKSKSHEDKFGRFCNDKGPTKRTG